jgi:hypothetical protein
MSFLYFIPECVDPPELDKLAQWGLAYAFEAPPAWTLKGGGSGPGGASGLLMAGQGTELGYVPARQTWRELPIVDFQLPITQDDRKTRSWLGFWNEKRPGPQTLGRRAMLSGHAVRLADGQEYHIASARKMVTAGGTIGALCALPHRRDVDGEGRWKKRTLLAEYAELWAIAERFWDFYLGASSGAGAGTETPAADVAAARIDDELLYAWATAALAVNYRVAAVECAMLELFDDRNVLEVLRALIDWPTLMEWSKKKAPAAT